MNVWLCFIAHYEFNFSLVRDGKAAIDNNAEMYFNMSTSIEEIKSESWPTVYFILQYLPKVF